MSQAVVISFLLALITSLQLSTNASRLLASTAVTSSESDLASGVNHELHASFSQLLIGKEDNVDGRHESKKENIIGEMEVPTQEYVYASSYRLSKSATVAERNIQLNTSTLETDQKEDSSDPCSENEIMSAGLSMFSLGSNNETTTRTPSTKNLVSAADVLHEDISSVLKKEEGPNLSILGTAFSSEAHAGKNSKQLSKTISAENKKKIRFGILTGPPSGPNPGGNSHLTKIRGKKSEARAKFSDDPDSASEESSMTPIVGSSFSDARSHSINGVSTADIFSTFDSRLTPNPGSGPRPGGN